MRTLTPSRPQTHLFSPKQALHIQGMRLIPQAHMPGWQGERESLPVDPGVKHVRRFLEKPLLWLWSPTPLM